MDSTNIVSNPYIISVTKILLLLFAAQIAPRAPTYFTDMFKNVYVKIVLIALMLFFTLHDFQYSIIFAIILVLGMNVASGRSMLESYINMENVSEYSKTYKPVGKFTLLDPKNNIFPGCLNVTQNDLLKLFDNDHYKLHTSAQHAYYELLNDKTFVDLKEKERLLNMAKKAGLPYNIEINDENAPYIATLLVNYNFIVSDTCKPPAY